MRLDEFLSYLVMVDSWGMYSSQNWISDFTLNTDEDKYESSKLRYIWDICRFTSSTP